MLARTKPVPIRFKAVHPNLKRKVANLIHLTRLQLVRNSLKALTLRHQLVHLSLKAVPTRLSQVPPRMRLRSERIDLSSIRINLGSLGTKPVNPSLKPVLARLLL